MLKVDKAAILNRMIEYSTPYRQCPAFNWERAIKVLNELPDCITQEERRRYADEGWSAGKDSINVGPVSQPRQTSHTGCGCGALAALVTLVATLIFIIIII